jgi:hypothetical protein
MKVRTHRGSLDDSMETVAEIPATLDALIEHMHASFGPLRGNAGLPPVTRGTVHVKYYCRDERIGWDTYMVTIDGWGAWGFTDGPVAP